ncbi:MAG: cysteinyl-tRNA synthetase [Sphaerobacter sp.]|nr:cysteinyl-tRNA synthetase [Sphaerobacter sp.]
MVHGPIALFGSGETSKHGRQVHAHLFERLPRPVRVAIVETPAGFQPNVGVVSGRLRRFFEQHLSPFAPEIRIVAARRRGGVYDPDAPAIVAPLEWADYIFAGPGSPTYAVRHLAGTRTLALMQHRAREGAILSLASAAAIAAGRYALPVYEIYKAGADLHWAPGLDLFGPLGLDLTVVPHWNNAEGGRDLDTTHCFMGAERFRYLRRLLPAEATILAIDEQTACVLEPAADRGAVLGAGQVRVLRGDREHRFARGETFPLALLRVP